MRVNVDALQSRAVDMGRPDMRTRKRKLRHFYSTEMTQQVTMTRARPCGSP